MLRLGVFGGKYMTDTRKEFPKSWFTRAKLSLAAATRAQLFGVDASQPLSVWRNKGWIHPDDPRGWFQWYCRYYMAAAYPTKTGARSGDGRRCAGTSGKSSGTASRVTYQSAAAAGAAAVGL